MSGLTDKEIKSGMIVRLDHLGSIGLGKEYRKEILSNHMLIVDCEYCPACKMNHYRAKFINTHSVYRNYTVNAYQLLKANSN